MRLLSTVSVLAASVSVLAQGTETSTATATQSASGCAAQNILDACIDSIQIQVDACGPNEWECLCEQTNNLLTCYNNCPEDSGRFGVEQQKTSYCNAAGAFSSTTTSTTTATTAATTTTETATSTVSEAATSTTDGAGAAETSDGAAGSVRVDMGVGAGVGVGLALLGALM
ncbi:hypothetical protein BJX61DRAFT_538508 [Aspergillus egyptiacus]|nr:hypothetical protein BJX61DRAFT_538508 [Aspergillus egyptiacus]